MVKSAITRDLSLLICAKLLVLGAIYVVLFAPFSNRSDDTLTHILGAPPQHVTEAGS